MMNEDLHVALPLWSLDRRGDGPRGTATTREVVGPVAMIRRILAAVRLRRAHVRSRQQLRELDNHLLKDIGLGREAVDYTSQRPELYWD